jgi:hypothetical protein
VAVLRRFAAIFGLAVFLLKRKAKETIMNKTFSCIGLVLAGSLLVACGSSNGGQKTAPTCISPADPSCRIGVDPPSVVRWVAPITDAVASGVSTAVVEQTPGKTCMSGKIDPGPSGAGWGAILLFELAQRGDGTTVVTPFDVKARGITQVRFNLSNPPPTGVLPQLVELTSADCTTAPDCQAQFGGPPALTSAGSITVALGDLVTPDAQHANQVSDPTISTGLQFVVSPLPSKAFDYDFCIQGLQFLDAAGNEVSR